MSLFFGDYSKDLSIWLLPNRIVKLSLELDIIGASDRFKWSIST